MEFFGVLTFDPELSAVGFPQANGANIDAEFESAFIEDHVSVLLPASKVRQKIINVMPMIGMNS